MSSNPKEVSVSNRIKFVQISSGAAANESFSGGWVWGLDAEGNVWEYDFGAEWWKPLKMGVQPVYAVTL